METEIARFLTLKIVERKARMQEVIAMGLKTSTTKSQKKICAQSSSTN